MNDRVRIDEAAPYTQGGGWVDPLQPGERGRTGRGIQNYYDATITIDVRPLSGRSELGELWHSGRDSARFDAAVARAVAQKSEEDQRNYGMSTAQMRTLAQSEDGGRYFGSPAHNAWAEAASARTGGRLSADFWRNFDPFGGTNGNGPEIMGGGLYPHPLSRIGMAHDTDWSLGRYFGAGPLQDLRGASGSKETLGSYGLDPFNQINNQGRAVDSYLNGHPDWDVRYHPRGHRRAEGDDGIEVAQAGSTLRADPNFASARAGIGQLTAASAHLGEPGAADQLAGTLAAESTRQRMRIDSVVESADGQRVFALQGRADDPSHQRVAVETRVGALQSLAESERQILAVATAPATAVEPQETRSRGIA